MSINSFNVYFILINLFIAGGKLYVNVKTGHSSLKRPEIPCYDITTSECILFSVRAI